MQTPLGPSVAIRLREVSAYERLKNTNYHSELGVSVTSSDQCLRFVHVNAHKNYNYGKIVPKKTHLELN